MMSDKLIAQRVRRNLFYSKILLRHISEKISGCIKYALNASKQNRRTYGKGSLPSWYSMIIIVTDMLWKFIAHLDIINRSSYDSRGRLVLKKDNRYTRKIVYSYNILFKITMFPVHHLYKKHYLTLGENSKYWAFIK